MLFLGAAGTAAAYMAPPSGRVVPADAAQHRVACSPEMVVAKDVYGAYCDKAKPLQRNLQSAPGLPRVEQRPNTAISLAEPMLDSTFEMRLEPPSPLATPPAQRRVMTAANPGPRLSTISAVSVPG